MNMNRSEFRRTAIKKRDAILQRDYKSGQIAAHLFALPVYQKAKTVYLYLSCRSEVETQEILTQVWKDGKIAAAPRVHGEEMQFYRICSLEDLESGAFGIWEPKSGCSCCTPEEGDLMLVPGCAFSGKGGRMGYGKGYYDRYLSAHHGCFLLGLAFEEQMTEELILMEHDQCMDAVLTQEALWSQGQRNTI